MPYYIHPGAATFSNDYFGHWDSILPFRYECSRHEKSLQQCDRRTDDHDLKACSSTDATVSLACNTMLTDGEAVNVQN